MLVTKLIIIHIYRRFPKNSAEINLFRSCLAEQLGKNVQPGVIVDFLLIYP